MDNIIIFGAKYLLVFSVVIAAWYFLRVPREKRLRIFIFSALTMAVAFVLSRILGHFFYDPRPFVAGNFIPLIPHAPDNGFPSDHTLFASAIAFSVFYFNRRAGSILLIVAFLIGIARVFAGVHHLIDIVGSVAISFAAYLAAHGANWNIFGKKYYG